MLSISTLNRHCRPARPVRSRSYQSMDVESRSANHRAKLEADLKEEPQYPCVGFDGLFHCHDCGCSLSSSLVCNSCTHNFSVCGTSVDDKAVTAGEPILCASCYQCRNCKSRFKGSRYARISQGYFCRGCGGSLLQRGERKKQKKQVPENAQTNQDG